MGEGVTVVNDARAVIANPDIDIVIELIGGYGIAKALVLEAIAAGKTWSRPTRRCWPCMAPRFRRRVSKA